MKIQMKIHTNHEVEMFTFKKIYHTIFLFDNKHSTKLIFIHNDFNQISCLIGEKFQRILYNSFPKSLRMLNKPNTKFILKIYNYFCPRSASVNMIVLNDTTKKILKEEN